jgi:ATP synthase F1 complex assembly factor 2
MASRLEEEIQLELWGLVEGGHDIDRLNNAVSLTAVNMFWGALHNSNEIESLWQSWIK